MRCAASPDASIASASFLIEASLASALAAPTALYFVFAKGLNVPLPIGTAWTFLGI